MANSSRRAALTLGLIASGLVGRVGRVLGQEPREDAGEAPPASATKIGTVDIEAVFRRYEKAQALSETFKSEVLDRKRELAKLQESARREAKVLSALPPGTPDFAESQAKIGKLLKETHEQLRKTSEAEFTRREAEMLIRLNKEVRGAVRVIAERRGLTLVVRLASEPKATDATSALAAFSQSVIYAGPGTDITHEVIAWLNRGE